MSIVIEPLSQQTLMPTIALIDRVFPEQMWWEKASWTLSLSLMSGFISKLLLRLMKIDNCYYWVVLNLQKEVIGVTGLYQTPKDKKHAYWLDWTCVDPDIRGKGLGKQLLNFAIDRAKSYRIPYLRLYTSDLPDYAIAIRLYESLGFKLTSQKQEKYNQISSNTLYYQLNLKNQF
jgi:GNAT superfamily N-acetyltransferase